MRGILAARVAACQGAKLVVDEGHELVERFLATFGAVDQELRDALLLGQRHPCRDRERPVLLRTPARGAQLERVSPAGKS